MATRMPATQVAKAGVRNLGWSAGEDVGQQAVAGHGEPDARLAELEDEDGRDHADERAEEDDEPDQWRRWPPGVSETRLRALTTGAPSPAMDCQGTMPVRTTATPM